MLNRLIASLRETQSALELEVHPLLESRYADRAMLMRLHDVAQESARRARHMREGMIASRADDKARAAVDRLCRYFEGTADLIANKVAHIEAAAHRRREDE
jgi:hypothetical protein